MHPTQEASFGVAGVRAGRETPSPTKKPLVAYWDHLTQAPIYQPTASLRKPGPLPTLVSFSPHPNISQVIV